MHQHLVFLDAVTCRQFIDHIQQNKIITNAVIDHVFVIVKIIRVIYARWEKRRQQDALMLFGKVDEFIAQNISVAQTAVNEDGKWMHGFTGRIIPSRNIAAPRKALIHARRKDRCAAEAIKIEWHSLLLGRHETIPLTVFSVVAGWRSRPARGRSGAQWNRPSTSFCAVLYALTILGTAISMYAPAGRRFASHQEQDRIAAPRSIPKRQS